MSEFSVTQNGKPLDKSKYTWNKETRTFTTKEDDLVLDFSKNNSITFNTGSRCIFKAGDDCKFNTLDNCTFTTGSKCEFNTGERCNFNVENYCVFNTKDYCHFNARNNCKFNTGDCCVFSVINNCNFVTGSFCVFRVYCFCTFNTANNCTFYTNGACKFKTSYNCVFNIVGSACTLDVGEECILVRNGCIFEYYDISNKKITICPSNIGGYIENGYYYLNGKRQYKAVLANNILSKIISEKQIRNLTIYEVINHGKDKKTFMVYDGKFYSHGDTIEEARYGLLRKYDDK